MGEMIEGAGVAGLARLFERGPGAGGDDGHLLARFAERGDEAAFAALVARHGPMVLATARAVLRHEQDAEDAFQATFLTLARRAGTVRSAATLAAWLHRVAHRSAVAAGSASRQRRRREAEATPHVLARDRDRSLDRHPEPDLAAAVNAEVDRLPERHRRAVVLCDLEGLSYLEAAGRLGWSEPTLRNRLADARSRLRKRLARRGLAPGLMPLAEGFRLAPSSIVPDRLARLATRVAGGSGPPAAATVRLIALTLQRGMLMQRIQGFAIAILAATALGATGWLAAPVAGPPAPRAQAPAPPATNNPTPVAANLPGDSTIRGRVIDPEGRPVAGARVRTNLDFNYPAPPTVATTEADGSFTLPAPTKFRQAGPADGFRGLVATAPGFGPGWTIDTLRPDIVIRLVPPGPPIEGRLLDQDGKPVAGVAVQLNSILVPVAATSDLIEAPNLAAYQAASRDRPYFEGLRSLAVEQDTTTDADGRFRVAEVGAERIASLFVGGLSIRADAFAVMTVPALADPSYTRPESLTNHPSGFVAARFERRVEPTRPIVGTITDQATGQPLAGWEVQAADTGSIQHYESDLAAVSDDRGRFTLPGLPVAESYRVFLAPPVGQPYLPAGFLKLKAPEGAGPLVIDHAARRGVVVRGRVTDGQTGAPVAGSLNAVAFLSNPNLADFVGSRDSNLVYRYTDADGRYEVVVPPGPAIVGFRARDESRYPTGQGADAIAGIDPKFRRFRTVGRETYPGNFHILARIDPPVGTEVMSLDLKPEPARTVALAVVDPEGRPVRDVEVEGQDDFHLNLPVEQAGPTVIVQAPSGGQPRRVIVRDRSRKLVGSVVLKEGDRDLPPLRLGPWGEIRGRIVLDDGRPRPRSGLTAGGLDPAHPTPEPSGIFPGGSIGGGVAADADSRFHIVGLVPGLHYEASAVDKEDFDTIGGGLFDDVSVEPGQVRDLGDLRVRPLPKQ